MRITFVIDSLGAGGAERALSILANYWAEQGIQITILTFDDGSSEPFYSLHESIKFVATGLGTKNLSYLRKILRTPSLIRELSERINESLPHVVISYMDQANILSLLALKGSRTPTIVCEQVNPALSSITLSTHPWIMRKLMVHRRNRAYHKAARIVLLSSSSIPYFPRSLRRRISVIPNPIQAPPEQEADKTLPENTVLAIGRLEAQKNFRLLITAFAQVAELHPDWSLVIVGEGTQREKLEALVDELELKSSVSLPGLTNTPYALLRQAKIFAMSSDYEGFPLALCEAMAVGKPVVATDCPTGPSDLIKDGENGLLVPVGDLKAFADGISRLISGVALRATLAGRAPKVLNEFGVEQIAHQWEELIQAALRDSRS